MPKTVRKRYPVQCAACSHEFSAAKSMCMEFFAMNDGCGPCPKCKTFLRLEMTPDIDGEAMKSEPFDLYLARTQATAHMEVQNGL